MTRFDLGTGRWVSNQSNPLQERASSERIPNKVDVGLAAFVRMVQALTKGIYLERIRYMHSTGIQTPRFVKALKLQDQEWNLLLGRCQLES